MKKLIHILFLIISVETNAQMESKIRLGNFSLQVPDGIEALTKEERENKYVIQGQIPDEVYQTENDDVNVSFMGTFVPIEESQFPILKSNLEKQFINPNSEILNSEIVELDGKKFVLIQVLLKSNNVFMTNLVTSDSGKMVMVIISHSTNRKGYAEENEKIFKSLIIADSVAN